MTIEEPVNTFAPSRLVCGKCCGTFYSSVSYCCFDGSELLFCEPSNGSSSFGDAVPATGKQCKTCQRKYPVLSNFCGVDGSALVNWHDEQPDVSQGADSFVRDTAQLEPSQPVAERRPATVPPDSSRPTLIGRTLDGKYLLESVFAEGGMAVLYKARQTSIDRTVIVKVMRDSGFTAEDLQRFEREAKLLAKLNHPNIVAVYDFGFLDAVTPFLVMEHIRGVNLSDRVAERGLPGPREAIQIAIQICQGLQEAHRYDIVHRDLKPENIILHDDSSRPDWVKIVDFGIAHALGQDTNRLTRVGMVIGTPSFLAPELFNEGDPDQRCDIYSLGVLLFELITGRLPFEASDIGSLIAKIVTEEAPTFTSIRSEIPTGTALERTVRKCLERSPENRYSSVSELLAVLQDLYRNVK